MRIEKCEKIFITQEEADIWTKFEQILEGIEKETKNQDMITLIDNINSYLSDLWEEIEEVE